MNRKWDNYGKHEITVFKWYESLQQSTSCDNERANYQFPSRTCAVLINFDLDYHSSHCSPDFATGERKGLQDVGDAPRTAKRDPEGAHLCPPSKQRNRDTPADSASVTNSTQSEWVHT